LDDCNWYSVGQIADQILERVECIQEFSGSWRRRSWLSPMIFARAA